MKRRVRRLRRALRRLRPPVVWKIARVEYATETWPGGGAIFPTTITFRPAG